MESSKAGIICCSALVLVGVVVFAFSWGAVEPTEWGLKYNTFTKSIDNETSKPLYYSPNLSTL